MATDISPGTAGETVESRFDQFIERELSQTSQRLRLSEIVWAVLATVAWLLAAVLVCMVVDAWLLELSAGWRLAGLVLTLSVAAGIFCWTAMPPIVRRINPQYVAQMIERSGDSFHNSLLNYLMLRGRREQTRTSVYAAVSGRAARDLSAVEEERRVDFSRTISMAMLVAGLVALFIAYLVFSPRNGWASLGRIVAPGARIAPASRVTVSRVIPGDVSVFYGERIPVSCEVHGWKDGDPVRLVWSSRDGHLRDVAVSLQPDSAMPNVWRGILGGGPEGVNSDLSYHIEAGDGRSPVFAVSVRPNPTIAVQSIEIHPPDYTRLPVVRHTGRGEIRAPEGSRVHLTAIANQDIKLAWIELVRAESAGTVSIADSDVTVVQTIDLVPGENRSASGGFQLLLDSRRQQQSWTHYRIRFRNSQDQRNEMASLHPIGIIPDAAPEVSIVRPDRSPVDVAVNRSLAIEIQASDIDYEISDVQLVIDHRGSRLLDKTLSLPQDRSNNQVQCRYQLVPAELGLKAGDEIVFFARAFDNRISPHSYAPQPNESVTPSCIVRIVDADPAADPGNAQKGSDPPAGAADQNPGDAAAADATADPKAGTPTPADPQQKENPAADPQNPRSDQKPGDSPPGPDGVRPPPAGQSPPPGEPEKENPRSNPPESRPPQTPKDPPGEQQASASEKADSQPQSSGAAAKGQESGSSGAGKPDNGSQSGSRSGSEGGNQAGKSGGSGESGENGAPSQAESRDPSAGSSAQSGSEKAGSGNGGASDSDHASDRSSATTNTGNQPGQAASGNKPGSSGGSDPAGSQSQDPAPTEHGGGGGEGSRDESLRSGQREPLGKNATDSERLEVIQEFLEDPEQNSESGQPGQENPDSGKPGAGQSEGNSSPPGESGSMSGVSSSADPAGDPADPRNSQAGDPSGRDGSTGEKPVPGSQPGAQESGGEPKSQEPSAGSQSGSRSGSESGGNGDNPQPAAQGSAASRNEGAPPGEKSGSGSSAAEKSTDSQANSGAESGSGSNTTGGNEPGRDPESTEASGSKSGDLPSGQDTGPQNRKPDGNSGGSTPPDKSGDRQESAAGQSGGKPENQGTDNQGTGNQGEVEDSTRQGESQEAGGGGDSQDPKGRDQSSGNPSGSDPSGKPGSGNPENGSGDPSSSAKPSGGSGQEPGASSAESSAQEGSGGDRESSQPGKGGSQQPSPPGQGQSNQAGSSTGGGGTTGGSGGRNAGPGAGQQMEGLSDNEARQIEYNRAATELMLEKLEAQRNQPNSELLNRMNWTEEDFREFLDRWQKMKAAAQSGDAEAGRRYAEALRGARLAPGRETGASTVEGRLDSVQGLSEDGGVNRPPADLVPEFNAFMKLRARQDRQSGGR